MFAAPGLLTTVARRHEPGLLEDALDEARHDVGRAAGRGADDELDGLGRFPLLRRGRGDAGSDDAATTRSRALHARASSLHAGSSRIAISYVRRLASGQHVDCFFVRQSYSSDLPASPCPSILPPRSACRSPTSTRRRSILDLDAFEAQPATASPNRSPARTVKVRPHAKSHKCPQIALRQIALGAVGVCCQKVSEAEALVEGGVGDVLIANEVVGAAKLRRLAALAKQARVAVCADDAGNVQGARRGGARVRRDARRAGRDQRRREPLRRRARRARGEARAADRVAARTCASPGCRRITARAQHLRKVEERRAAIEKRGRARAATRASCSKRRASRARR